MEKLKKIIVGMSMAAMLASPAIGVSTPVLASETGSVAVQTEKTDTSDPVEVQDRFTSDKKKVVITAGEAKYIILPEASRDGYSFLYWNTEKDGSGTTYYAGDIFEIGSETRLFAIYS